MSEHCHGTLSRIVDSEGRPLRSIGATAYEVARRTGELLGCLLRTPAVRIYRGVGIRGHTPLPYALSSGNRVVLVDAVAWPPGSYATTASGAVLCGGTYIGQSARPLLGAVRHLRRLLPRGYRVSAVVVVHASLAGRLQLPVSSGTEVSWTGPGAAAATVHRALRSRSVPGARSRAVAVLAAASDPEGDRPLRPASF